MLTWPTDTGSGGFTHQFFRAAQSRDELIEQRDAIAGWARMSYGWMGRSPGLQGLADEHAWGQPPILRQVLR